MSLPVAFHDLKRSDLPVVVRFYDVATEELLDTITIDGAGVVKVPGFAPRRVRVEVQYNDGRIIHEGPPD